DPSNPDSASGTLTITIVDDAPVANADIDTTASAVATGNVITAAGTTNSGADTFGADGASVTSAYGKNGPGSAQAVTAGGVSIAGQYGTLVLHSDGSYTYATNPNSSGTDVFHYTLTDGDGDQSSTTLTITAINSSPSLSAATATTSDVAGDDSIVNSNVDAFTAQVQSGSMSFNFGGDGPNATTPFAYTYDNGLGTAIQSLSTNGSGQTILTLTSASWVLTLNEVTGAYSFTQTGAYQHDVGATSDSGIVTVILTDSDGTTAVKTLTMTINDDVPTLGTIDHGVVANEANITITGQMPVDGGADHPVTASLAGNTAPANLTVGGNAVHYYVDPNNPQTLVAYTGNDHTQNNVFTLTVNPVTGTYTYTELKALDAFTTVSVGGSVTVPGGPVDSVLLTSGSNGTGTSLAVISGWHGDAGFNLANWLAATPGSATTGISLHAINGNSNGFGVDSGNFNAGDIIRFDFGAPTDYDGAGPYTASSTTANVTSATLTFTKSTTVDYVIHYTDSTTSSGSFTSSSSVVIPSVTGTKFIDYIELYSEGAAGKVTLADTTTASNTGTTNLNFGVTVTDHDGDSASGTIGITVDGDHTLNATAGVNNVIAGGSSADTLVGGTGNDLLIGGGGNDTLTGGAGADQFRMATNTGTDVIKDFAHGTDKIGLLDTGVNGSGSVNFANTVGSSSGTALNASDFVTHTSVAAIVAADSAHIIQITAAQTAAQIAAAAGAATNAYVLVFDSTTSRGELWFDTDWSTAAGRTQVATFDNITSLSPLTALNNTDFVVHNSTSDPIILDLNHDGFAFSDISHGVQFDINGDGVKDQVAWNTSNDGILAMDLNHDGKIDDGTELFTPNFAGGHFASGSAALASLDSNHDGVIDHNDAAYSSLLIWKDANANGISDAGELSSLAANGITSISTTSNAANGEIDGQTVTGTGSFHTADGTSGNYVEVALDTALGAAAQPAVAADGSKTFAIGSLEVTDLISDFHDGDKIDLSSLLKGLSGVANLESEGFVELAQSKDNPANAEVKVDTNGGGDNFHTVAVLENYALHSAADAIKVLYDDGHGTKTATI
ncbi:type I secretion C-terminal target domain-containing protein, partial [Mesorhizobium sp. B3-1-3]|uniref:beta strand repeat-containing protein n=1 Tax=unclassified Mesorhizobium TaxID=325217 RepID=UPI00112A6F90